MSTVSKIHEPESDRGSTATSRPRQKVSFSENSHLIVNPSPSPSSIFAVPLGGESSASVQADETALIRVLDREHIKYAKPDPNVQLDELLLPRNQHVRALEPAQSAPQKATSYAVGFDEQSQRAREQIGQYEGEVAGLRSELETMTTELEAVRLRLTNVENAWTKSREEADAFRALTTTSLDEFLDAHRDLKSEQERFARGHAERVQAMEAEAVSLRVMLKIATERLEDSHGLANERRNARESEMEAPGPHTQATGLRDQLSSSQAESGRACQDLALLESELKQKAKDAGDAVMRLDMLRNYLVKNNTVLNNDSLVAELEKKLAQYTRLQEQTERDLQTVLSQKQDALARVSAMSTQLDCVRSTQSPTLTQNNLDDSTSDTRVIEAQRSAEDVERSYKARLQKLEDDYRLAVQLVKETERLNRRMKDELMKQKALNTSLLTEIDSLRGSSGGTESTVRILANGRDTAFLGDGCSSDSLNNQLVDMQRRAQRAIIVPPSPSPF